MAPGSSLMSALAPTKTRTERETATATWYVQKGSNDTWFRCDAPAEAVGGRVAYVTDWMLDRATMYPNRDTGLPWHAELTTADGTYVAETKKAWNDLCRGRITYSDIQVIFPEHAGAAVFTRPCGRRAILAQFMRNQEILTVAETDDNYMADKWWNLHQRQVGWNDEAKEVVCRAMASMDRNVFSTAWLRDRYHREYKKRLGKQGLPEMFVCRNHVPRWDWPERDEAGGKIRVGFMGSGSHVWDVQKIYLTLGVIKKHTTDFETVMIGYNPGSPDNEPDELEINGETYQMRSEKSKRFRDGWAKVVDRHIPWIDPGDYRRAALPLDIGLAPLARADDFTMGKSDAKALEYTISGAACVLSNSGIYNTAGWKHEVNCLMANSVEEFTTQTLRLMDDPKLRFELVTAAQEMVWNERNEDVLRDEWSAALS